MSLNILNLLPAGVPQSGDTLLISRNGKNLFIDGGVLATAGDLSSFSANTNAALSVINANAAALTARVVSATDSLQSQINTTNATLTTTTATANNAQANANTALNAMFNKTSGTAQQVLNIPSFNAAAIDIVQPNVLRARITVDGAGNMILQNGDNGTNYLYVTTAGQLWTKQLGDNYTYWANQIANLQSQINSQSSQLNSNSYLTSMRLVFAGDYYNGTNLGNGMNSPYGGIAVCVDRQTDYGNAGDLMITIMRFRYIQMYVYNQGWITVYAAS